MAFPLYLAMTAAEIQKNTPLPSHLAYMACHFSPYGTGLSNAPRGLPEGSLLILNDRTPIHGHDPVLVGTQLTAWCEEFRCQGVLLDFQRPGCAQTAALTNYLAETLPYPLAVSEAYAEALTCPVLLPPVPLDTPIGEYLSPWTGREIWLEAGLDASELTLTPSGCAVHALPFPITDDGLTDAALHCHYRIQTDHEKARFTLWRTEADLEALLANAHALGVTRALGLWQELGQ